MPTGCGVRSSVKWHECHEKRNFYLRQLPNNAMGCLVRYCVLCHLDGSTRSWCGIIIAQERDPSCPVRPWSYPSVKRCSSFSTRNGCVASVLHIMILCVHFPHPLHPPTGWQAGPTLVLETQGPDKTQIWPGLAPKGPWLGPEGAWPGHGL